ncbi:MAG: choloylglycine hydrolase [Oscillospiraceae bacterium]|nr:choloylglycine hydrolase [Oscillospiraceae bacterium]
MCTALSYKTDAHYFGRTLDLEYSYDERVTITPRNYPFRFRKAGTLEHHYALIGMAYVAEDYPLYYEAVNEHGLGMAGLNFPQSACYYNEETGKDNVSPFEFIPWILCQCVNVTEAEEKLARLNLVRINFSEKLPLSPLHWIIADRDRSIVVEAMADGMRIRENPVGVMTNEPPFDYQLFNLNNYMSLTKRPPENTFAEGLSLRTYSRGMGALGLPGDLSSMSRFVRAAYLRMNAVCGGSESESVSQFFHILGGVEQQRGAVQMPDGRYELTIYTSCCNTDRGIYYYTTYENHQITAVDMHKEDLDGTKLTAYPLITGEQIRMQN